MAQIDERPRSAWTARSRDDAPRPPRGGGRRWLTRVGVVAGAVVVLIALVAAGTALAHRGTALPGVVVGGVDVGGLGEDGVRAALDDVVAERRSEPVTLHHDGAEFVFVPGATSYGADVDAAVAQALAVGRDRSLLGDAWTHLTTLWGATFELELADDVVDVAARAWVAEVAAEIDLDPFPGRVTADPDTLTIRTAYPAPGVRVLRDDAVALVLDAVRTPGSERVPLPVEHLPQQVEASEVDRVAVLAGRAIAEPLVLSIHGTSVTLTPRDLATLVDTRLVEDADPATLALAAPVDAVEALLSPHERTMTRDPVSARLVAHGPFPTFDPQSDASWRPIDADVEIVPSTSGTRFDPELAATQLSALLTDGVREAELDLEIVEPDLTTQGAHDLNITKLVGAFTTYHPCCQTRVQNIQRMADIVRGAVIRPGETFSLNGHVGRRTIARGFAEGGTIVGGEFVSEVGGGVSQFATTMYNASFFAGIEIPEHKAHSFYISRYPMGREATVYYPSVDLKVRNTTSNGLLVHTRYTGTSISVYLFGDNGDLDVRASHGNAHNHRTRGDIVRENKALAPGTERVIQSSAQGFDVVVERRITPLDGESRTERIFTRYLPQPRIVERNSDPAPEPSPTPTPTPSPTPTQPPSDPGDGDGGDGDDD